MNRSLLENLRYEVTIKRVSDRKNIELEQDLFTDGTAVRVFLEDFAAKFGITDNDVDANGEEYTVIVTEYDVAQKCYPFNSDIHRFRLANRIDCYVTNKLEHFSTDHIYSVKDVSFLKCDLTKARAAMVDRITQTKYLNRVGGGDWYTFYFKNGNSATCYLKNEFKDLCDKYGTEDSKDFAVDIYGEPCEKVSA